MQSSWYFHVIISPNSVWNVTFDENSDIDRLKYSDGVAVDEKSSTSTLSYLVVVVGATVWTPVEVCSSSMLIERNILNPTFN